jgi:excisionase family DNA binding protein
MEQHRRWLMETPAGPTTPEPLLTAREVAALLKASESLVYKLQRQGRLPAVRIGWLLRFNQETVRAFMRGESPSPRERR